MTQPSFSPMSDADFDAYLPARATSNAFVRARIPVKEKLLALGRALGERASTAGLALEVGASDERPSIWNRKSVTCQWVFLWRDRAARAELEKLSEKPAGLTASLMDPTPYDKHAFLALYLDAERFEVCLRLHRDAWADVKNARSRIESEAGRAAIDAALHALAPDFAVSVVGGEALPVGQCDTTALARLLEQAVASGSWLSIGRAISRTQAIELGESIVQRAIEAFDMLVAAYRVLAWSPDDDLAAVGADLVRARAAHDAHVAEVKAREEAWTAEHTAEIERRREEAMVEARERLAALERARPGAVQIATAAFAQLGPATPRPQRLRPPARGGTVAVGEGRAPAKARESQSAKPGPKHFPLLSDVQGGRDFRTAAPRTAPRREVPDDQLVESDRAVGVGSRVRIRQGAFAGKSGTVTEIDARGARVAIGALSARVEVGDLVTLVEK